jgi:hypothetical protein
MSSILKITKFHFLAVLKWQIVSCLAVLLINLLISAAVIKLTQTTHAAGTNDMIAMVYMFVLGIVIFSPAFKYVLYIGVSRRRFFLAMGLNIVLLAIIFAILVMIIYVSSQKIANEWTLYTLIYRDQNILGMLVWEFAIMLFLGVLGWFIRLVYYVSNRNTQLIISIAPIILISLLILFNALADGGIGQAFWEFLKTVMGFSTNIPNPYIGTVSMLAAAVILGVPIFLLLRRAQIKD